MYIEIIIAIEYRWWFFLFNCCTAQALVTAVGRQPQPVVRVGRRDNRARQTALRYIIIIIIVIIITALMSRSVAGGGRGAWMEYCLGYRVRAWVRATESFGRCGERRVSDDALYKQVASISAILLFFFF